MRKLIIGLSAAAVLSLLTTEPASARKCTDELQACRARCSGTYKFTGERLSRCVKDDCPSEFYICMRTGQWKTRDTTITGLERR